VIGKLASAINHLHLANDHSIGIGNPKIARPYHQSQRIPHRSFPLGFITNHAIWQGRNSHTANQRINEECSVKIL
jgi:hypothetical protein